MMLRPMSLAIVGTDTALGSAMIEALEDERFTLEHFMPVVAELDSHDPDQQISVRIKGHSYEVMTGDDCPWQEAQVAIFCLGDAKAQQWMADASDAGVTVIDASGTQQYDAATALMQAGQHTGRYIPPGSRIVAPDPAVMMLTEVLAPVHHDLGVERVSVTAMLSASHAGKAGVNALAGETAKLLNGMPAEPDLFPVQAAFNVIPVTGETLDDGYTACEQRIAVQLRELLDDDQLFCCVTAVQVPLFYGFGLVVEFQTRVPADLQEIRTLLEGQPEITLFEDGKYPTAVTEMLESDKVMVARLRQAEGGGDRFTLWILSDNVKVAGALHLLRLAQEAGHTLM